MKRRLQFVLLLSILLLLTSCGSSKPNASKIGSDVGVNISDNATVEYDDTHGGFHGDGETFAKVVLSKSENNITADICKSNPHWKSLPVPTEIAIHVFGGEYNGISYGYGDERMKPAQKIKNGIYYFEDRYMELYPNESSSYFECPSYNFTFAIYDFDQHTFYYYKYDS